MQFATSNVDPCRLSSSYEYSYLGPPPSICMIGQSGGLTLSDSVISINFTADILSITFTDIIQSTSLSLACPEDFVNFEKFLTGEFFGDNQRISRNYHRIIEIIRGYL